MISRKGGQSMVGPVVRLITAMGGKPTKSLVRGVKFTLRSFSRIAATQGIFGLIKYLKTVSVCIQQAISGHKPQGLTPRVSLNNQGIPRVLPRSFRRLIRSCNFLVIRLSLTLGSLYRDIPYTGKFSTETITKPYSGTTRGLNRIIKYIPLFVRLFVVPVVELPLNVHNRRDWLKGKFSFFPISRSAPMTDREAQVSTNPLVMIKTAANFTDEQVNWIQILFRLFSTDRVKTQEEASWPYSKHATLYDYIVWVRGVGTWLQPFKIFKKTNLPTGKLGTKVEAAGKVRVFAMVDPWTQMVLRPFHDLLFRILRKHNTVDGTFDQLRPLKRAWSFNQLYSMDLSSATDRLPLVIQIKLFREIFCLSKEESEAWGNLLVKRDYSLPRMSGRNSSVRYSVGQPMGALSSWAMLAFTHHLIVNVAAWESGHSKSRLFKNYAILGDDIVIYDRRVAKWYYIILTSIGVECSLAKSIFSPKGKGLEFAKKTFFLGRDVSPTPFKEFYSALQSPIALLSYATKYSLSITNALKVAGFGYKVLGGLNRPLRSLNFKVQMVLISSSLTAPSGLKKLIESKFPNLSEYVRLRVDHQFMEDLFTNLRLRYYSLISKIERVEYSVSPNYQTGPIMHYLEFLYGIVYGSYKERLLHRLNQVKIESPFFSTIERKVDDPLEEIVNYVKMEEKISSVSLETFEMKASTIPTKRSHHGSLPVLFRFSESWQRVISAVSKEIRKDQPKEEVMESSFFPLRLLPFRNIFTLRRMLTIFKRRITWFGSMVSLISFLAYFKGLQPVFEVIVAISSLFSILWMVDETVPGTTWIPWLGNFLFHVFELWFAAGFVVLCCNWSEVYPFIRTELLAYNQGLMPLRDILFDILKITNELIYNTATGVATSLPEVIATSGVPLNILLGAFGGQLLWWLLKWLFGY